MTAYIYARVSTVKQKLDSQIDTLVNAYPNTHVITDKASGKNLNREGFDKMNETLKAGDVVIVYDLSRLGRNTGDLINLVEDWNKRDIGLVVHNMMKGETVDTRTATGKLMFTVLAAVGQMQREIQAEKAAIGMAKAVADGKMKGGRPHKTEAIAKAVKLLDKGLTKEEASKAAGISVMTLYRHLKKSASNAR